MCGFCCIDSKPNVLSRVLGGRRTIRKMSVADFIIFLISKWNCLTLSAYLPLNFGGRRQVAGATVHLACSDSPTSLKLKIQMERKLLFNQMRHGLGKTNRLHDPGLEPWVLAHFGLKKGPAAGRCNWCWQEACDLLPHAPPPHKEPLVTHSTGKTTKLDLMIMLVKLTNRWSFMEQ